jgi:hypothetical protein
MNNKIGMAKDNSKTLINAANYLNRDKSSVTFFLKDGTYQLPPQVLVNP